MKRLLAYLFLVLGLGLVLSFNGKAASVGNTDKDGYSEHTLFCIKKKGDDGNWPFYKEIGSIQVIYDGAKCPKNMKKVSKPVFIKFKKIIDDKYIPKSTVSISPKKIKPIKSVASHNTYKCGDKDWMGNTVCGEDWEKKQKTQITKAETSETQELALNNNALIINFCIDSKKRLTDKIFPTLKDCSSLNNKYGITKYVSSNYELFLRQDTKIDQSGSYWKSMGGDFETGNENFICFNNSLNKVVRRTRNCKEMNLIQVNYDGKKFYYGDTQETQIAKKEPSQTQEATSNNKKTNNRQSMFREYDMFLNKKYKVEINQRDIDRLKNYIKRGDFSINNQDIIAKIDKTNLTTQNFIDHVNQEGISLVKIKNNLDKNIVEETIRAIISSKLLDFEIKEHNLSIDDRKLVKIIKENKNFHDENGFFQRTKYEKFLLLNNITAVEFEEKLKKYELRKLLFDSVADGTISPKKKVKVAKVEEPKQEEFKPETGDIDNDAPVIQIAEAITVDSQAYTLKGKVKDKSKIYLTIDGRQVQVKKGKFKVDRFNIDPGEVEEIKIVAIDKWNNKTEKTIKVTIDLKSTELARSFEDLKPNSVRVKTDKNKIAIIIGIEKYENLTNLDAKYANRDAKAFRAYATKALGVKSSNIKLLVDDKATRSQTLKAFKLWLPKIAGDGGKDIHIFFAGHGLASDNGEDLYILPQDGESSLLEDTAISRVELISLIQKVNPKSVTMFFDTCYSGQTRDERLLVASLRPIRIVAEEQDTPNNFTIFTASNYDQTSGSIEETKHGMFSYYLMKGLEGKADTNRDKKITNGELIAYLKTNVSKEAFTQNREQDPMLSGDPDQVLMSYR